jgi:hypothetical protein
MSQPARHQLLEDRRDRVRELTVRATFNEPKYMNLNSHPHPYGVFIGGNDVGTPSQTELYCAASGNGKSIVRGFGAQRSE